MKITFGDTETTGFEPSEGHRMCEIALLTYDASTRQLLDVYVRRIDPDRNMPAAAQAVHGITYESLVGCPKWEDIAGTVGAKLSDTSLFVAHNLEFDMRFLAHELLRVGVPLPPRLELFCTMVNGRWACPDGKSPRLEELCFALDIEFDPSKAHGAEYDTKKLAECFFAGLDRGFYQLPTALMVAA